MALMTKEEYRQEVEAMKIANDMPMGYHADGCPYLISDRRNNCRCNCFTSTLRNLRAETKR